MHRCAKWNYLVAADLQLMEKQIAGCLKTTISSEIEASEPHAHFALLFLISRQQIPDIMIVAQLTEQSFSTLRCHFQLLISTETVCNDESI